MWCEGCARQSLRGHTDIKRNRTFHRYLGYDPVCEQIGLNVLYEGREREREREREIERKRIIEIFKE
jgi:hypothetical protein